MNTSIILSYLLIIGGILVWGLLLPGRKKVSSRVMDWTTTFGGAFLFASCFINLVPHMYLEGFETPNFHFKVGAAALVGFVIQLFLERLTQGVEHGHNHTMCCGDADPHHDHHGEAIPHCEGHVHPMAGLMIGLCIHSFLEGMPMVDADGDIHQGLLYGIVLHNIPIALVLVTLCMSNHFKNWKSVLLLLVFAVMTPLGSLTGLYLVPRNEVLQALIMGVVVGILLHVSVSILFNDDHNKFSKIKFALIVLAFVAAYFTPGCPEIYPR